MSKKIFVGNLSFNATEAEVRDLFAEYGDIESIAMINDRETGRFRGFGFVEMDDAAATAAIEALDGRELDGRVLKVNEARPREERSGGGGGRSFGSRPSFGSGGGNRGGFSNDRRGGGGRDDRRDNFGGGGRNNNRGGGRW